MEWHREADGGCVLIRVPAKLNLFLAVRGRRDDGYHEIVTVMQTVSIYDWLRVGVVGSPGKGHHPAARRRMGLELREGGTPGMPEPAANLAVRAARLLGESTGVMAMSPDGGAVDPRTVIDLRKEIPVAAGMAGGSADAAGALLALNELWGCALGREQLRELAAGLGSDVPFCMVGGTALATGRGTRVAQVLCRGAFHWVVATSAKPLPTAEVYGAWDRHCKPSEIEPDAVLAALRSEDPEALGAALHNDLQEAAFALRPELAEQRAALLEAGALGAAVSGSGPTLLALALDRGAATRLAEEVRPLFDNIAVAVSPAGGPDLRPC